jgi:hypothetical protein
VTPQSGDVVGRYHAALDACDTDAIVNTFAPDGYYREPIGPQAEHRGAAELRTFFTRLFSAGGGIGLEPCAVTDDGLRCALEYNYVRWGSHDLRPQAESASMSAARTGCWPPPASTTTSNRPSGRSTSELVDVPHMLVSAFLPEDIFTG